jgi:hypothetical protein
MGTNLIFDCLNAFSPQKSRETIMALAGLYSSKKRIVQDKIFSQNAGILPSYTPIPKEVKHMCIVMEEAEMFDSEDSQNE